MRAPQEGAGPDPSRPRRAGNGGRRTDRRGDARGLRREGLSRRSRAGRDRPLRRQPGPVLLPLRQQGRLLRRGPRRRDREARRRLLGAARSSPDWRPCLRAALLALAEFLSERPLLARGLLVEVHVAGEPALARRAEVAEQLIAAIDRARLEAGSLPDQPPALTARFMLGAIESAATSALDRGAAAAFAAWVPNLTHMVVSAYFGEDAAAEELAPSTLS